MVIVEEGALVGLGCPALAWLGMRKVDQAISGCDIEGTETHGSPTLIEVEILIPDGLSFVVTELGSCTVPGRNRM